MIYYLVEYHKVRITLCFDSTDSFEKLSREIAGFPHTPIAEPVGRIIKIKQKNCLLYTSPSPRDRQKSRMPSSA